MFRGTGDEQDVGVAGARDEGDTGAAHRGRGRRLRLLGWNLRRGHLRLRWGSRPCRAGGRLHSRLSPARRRFSTGCSSRWGSARRSPSSPNGAARPRATSLYQVLDTHFETLKRRWEERFKRCYSFWRGLCDDAVARYLDCGIFESGFVRAVCPRCRFEFPPARKSRRRSGDSTTRAPALPARSASSALHLARKPREGDCPSGGRLRTLHRPRRGAVRAAPASLDVHGSRQGLLFQHLHLERSPPFERQHFHLLGSAGTVFRGNARRRDRLGVLESVQRKGTPRIERDPRGVFRATKIPPDHPALAGRELKPLDPQPTP